MYFTSVVDTVKEEPSVQIAKEEITFEVEEKVTFEVQEDKINQKRRRNQRRRRNWQQRLYSAWRQQVIQIIHKSQSQQQRRSYHVAVIEVIIEPPKWSRRKRKRMIKSPQWSRRNRKIKLPRWWKRKTWYSRVIGIGTQTETHSSWSSRTDHSSNPAIWTNLLNLRQMRTNVSKFPNNLLKPVLTKEYPL